MLYMQGAKMTIAYKNDKGEAPTGRGFENFEDDMPKP
jgi:hypothetical protein